MQKSKNIFKNTGRVKEIRDGIVVAEGLSDAGFNEVVNVITDSGIYPALVFNLDNEEAGLIILDEYKNIKEGDTIETTGKTLSIMAGEKLLGKVIDPVGNSLQGDKTPIIADNEKGSQKMPLDKIAPGVMERKNIHRPMATGIKAVDSMFPIGRGQRELIIGDRQTGKTAIATDAILSQKNENGNGQDVVCIYVSIGQKQAKIAQLQKELQKRGALEYTIIVAANAADPASLQYIAPFAGCAIGEYFAQQGKDALIIYDDLTKHAWAYRQISLLLRRPPGREAYPGDIFYLHSRLLERALQYSDDMGGGSLTALPIIETQSGDVSAYIPTNIISITDGQIYLEANLFYSGQRPAVNIGLSVSRVGGDAQIKAMKQIAGQLKLTLAQYNELSAFAQFGSDLDEIAKTKLDRGARIMKLLEQNQFSPVPAEIQACILYAGIEGYIDKIPVNRIIEWETQFVEFINKNMEKTLEKFRNGAKIENETEKELKKAIEQSINEL